jgi:hypothetical protein
VIRGSIVDWKVDWALAQLGAAGASWAAVDAKSCWLAAASASRMHASRVFRIDRIASNPMIACCPRGRNVEVSTAHSASKQGIRMTGA